MFNLKDIYLKEIKADYDYDREDDEDAFGEPLPDDDELKPGEIDSMNLDFTQQDKKIRKLLNKDTGFLNLPAIIAQIKDEKVKNALEPVLTKWNKDLKKYPDVAKEINSDIVKLQNMVIQQSFFYKNNKNPKSKEYIFQTKKFNREIGEIDSDIKSTINKVKGSVDKKNNILKAYNEFYKTLMDMKKDHELSVRIKEVIKKEIKENFDDRLRSMMGADDFKKTTNPKLSRLINNAIMSIDPNMSYKDFAKGVAQVLIDEYGVQNYEPFMSELKKELDSTLG